MSWGQFWTNHDGARPKISLRKFKMERCGSWHLALTGTLESFKSSRYRCETSTLFILMQVEEFHLGDKQVSSFNQWGIDLAETSPTLHDLCERTRSFSINGTFWSYVTVDRIIIDKNFILKIKSWTSCKVLADSGDDGTLLYLRNKGLWKVNLLGCSFCSWPFVSKGENFQKKPSGCEIKFSGVEFQIQHVNGSLIST